MHVGSAVSSYGSKYMAIGAKVMKNYRRIHQNSFAHVNYLVEFLFDKSLLGISPGLFTVVLARYFFLDRTAGSFTVHSSTTTTRWTTVATRSITDQVVLIAP